MTGRAQRACYALLALSAAHAVTGGVRSVDAQVAPDSTSSLVGWVVEHETGEALAGATVLLVPTGGRPANPEARISGDEGAVVFTDLPPGLYRLSVSLLGYTDLRDTLRVVPTSEIDVTLPLSVSPISLEPIIVVVPRRPAGPLRGFEHRRVTARGTFMDREDIESRNSQQFTDLMRPVPGIRLVPDGAFGHRLYLRGCVPDLWIDGVSVGTDVDIDSFLHPEDVEAVEVYRGPDLPGEFGANMCGAMVVWTRRGRTSDPDAEGSSIKKQLIMAGSLLAAFLGVRLIG